MSAATYRNPWHTPNGSYGPALYTTTAKPVQLGKYTRYQRIPGNYDFVFNGVCFAQRAGPATEAGIDADKFAQENLQRFCGVKFGPTWTDAETAMTRLPNFRRDFAADPYLAHYFRLARLHCGPSLIGRNAGPRRVDEIGIKATVKLREIFRNEPKPGLIEVLAFTGKRWASGWSVFEDRVAAVGASYSEGALLSRQAA